MGTEFGRSGRNIIQRRMVSRAEPVSSRLINLFLVVFDTGTTPILHNIVTLQKPMYCATLFI